MPASSPIGNVPLYFHPERVEEELAAMGLGATVALSADQIAPFDQMHYYGNESVARAAARLGLRTNSQILDIGSGFGGAARYLAAGFGCRVTAIELQDSIHSVALRLTRRSGLSDHVVHVRADALEYHLPEHGFDTVVSWLAIVHIPQRRRLFERTARALRPKGGFYIEDCICQPSATREDLRDLESFLSAQSLSGIAAYVADLTAAGFRDIDTTDMTPDWVGYVTERLVTFKRDRSRYIEVHGVRGYEALLGFYAEIVRFYNSGTLGGVRILAHRP